MVYSILKNISNDFGQGASEIAFYAQYIIIVTVGMSTFTQSLDMARQSIQSMVTFMHSLVPLLMTLMLVTGSIATSNLVQPIILFSIQFIGNIINTLVLPFILISTALGVVSNISSKVQIDKLASLLKSSTIWVMGTILTIFVTLLSLEGTMSSTVDGLTVKITKSAVSTFVPIVGKILGDATDSVLGATNILKNAIGLVGIIVIILICIVPVVKLAILSITFHITSSILQPIADSRIIKLLDSIGSTYKILFGIVFAVSFILVIRCDDSCKIRKFKCYVLGVGEYFYG